MVDDYLKLNGAGHLAKTPEHFMRREEPMDYLFIWLLAGRGFGKSEGRRIEAGPGHLLTFKPGEPHEYGADEREPWDIVWIHFSGRLAAALVKQIRAYGGVGIDLGLDDELCDRWNDLVIAHNDRIPRFDVKVDTALCALLGLILHRLQMNAHQPRPEASLDVRRLQSYIHHHVAEPLTLADLAHQANLSPTHFSRMFRRHFAVSPMHYVIQKRMALACSLLTETPMPLKQISQAIGYEDPYYFSRLFKKAMGVNPSAYRQTRRSFAKTSKTEVRSIIDAC